MLLNPIQVEILNVSTGQQARFYYNGWLSKDEPPYQLEVELTVEGDERPTPHRYTVTTYTSDIRGEGTDANVSIIMFGDKCNSPLMPLANRWASGLKMPAALTCGSCIIIAPYQ